MKYVLISAMILFQTHAIAQDNPFHFTEINQGMQQNSGFPIHSESRIPLIQETTTGALKELLVEISFFRGLHSRLSSSPNDIEQTLKRYDLSTNEAEDIVTLLGAWKQQTAVDASQKIAKMCEQWNSRNRSLSDEVNANFVLNFHRELDADISDQRDQIEDLKEMVSRYTDNNSSSLILFHLEVRQRSKPDIGYLSFADGVSRRGNSVEELETICGGVQ
jgi:hypothetical protein